jgi:GNAT superfamily N-acetyltransferase
VPEPARVTLPTRVWYLELGELRPARAPLPAGAGIARAEVPFGPLNRFFYEEVGRDLHWVDRLGLAPERWQAWAEQVETWLVWDRGTPAGFAELARHPGRVDIATFGLLAPFRGRGLGGALLTRVTQRGLELADRVTVNTCELDGPHARAHYEARGFELVREEVEERGRRDLLH